MNNNRLRALLVRLQDRLSEDDRRRLHFFFGNDVPRRIRDDPTLSGTLSLMESLFDQDKINEDDFTFLINAFDEIQCRDAVKLLREYMREMQSKGMNESVQSLNVIMPPLFNQVYQDLNEEEDEDKYPTEMSFINRKTSSNNNNNNNILIQNTNKHIDPIREMSTRSKSNQYVIIIFIFSIVLCGIVIGGCVWIIQLKNNQLNNYSTMKDLLLQEKELFDRFKNALLKDKEFMKIFSNSQKTIEKFDKRIVYLEDDLKFTEGTTCGCSQWCHDHNSVDGICLDGHACECTNYEIGNGTILRSENCRCHQWCQRRNYKKGGICGDGYTCICFP